MNIICDGNYNRIMLAAIYFRQEIIHEIIFDWYLDYY